MRHAQKNLLLSVFLLTGSLLLVACGGGGSNGNNDDPEIKNTGKILTGVFLDSAVQGLTYKTRSLSGKTDSNGTFSYRAGELITFSLGLVDLGKSLAKGTITPLDLYPDAQDANNPTITNIIRLLQTLDTDSNPENGITLPENLEITTQSLAISFDQSVIDFENDSNLQNFLKQVNNTSTLIDPEQARAHFNAIFDTNTATINDVDFLTSDTLSITENSNEKVTVQTNASETDAITFQITGGDDQNLFTIDNNTGLLNFNANPDYESPQDKDQNNEYLIEVTFSFANDSKSKLFRITVSDADDNELTAIVLDSTEPSLNEGSSLQLTIEGQYSNEPDTLLVSELSWFSDDETVATLDSNGLLTAIGPGTAQISVSKNNIISNSLLITVIATPVSPLPLTVIQSTPSDKQSDIPVSTVIEVFFSNTIQNEQLAAAISVNDGSSTISGSTSLTNGGKVIVFTPSSTLQFDTNYTVTIKGSITDLNETNLGTDFIWQFSTEMAPISQEPIAIDDRLNTSVNISLSISQERLLSNDSDPENQTLTIINIDSITPNGGIITKNNDETYTYLPAANYAGEDFFNYTIENENNKQSIGRIIISVLEPKDTTAPTVVETKPINNQTNVAIDNKITVIFSEEIRPVSLDAISVTNAGKSVTGTISLNQKTMTFTPSAALAVGSTYLVSIKTDVSDLAENPLATPYNWQFSTMAQDLNPIATDDTLTTVTNGTVTYNVLSNDSDPGNNSISILSLETTSTKGGTIVDNKDGTITYLSAENFDGPDQFQYTIENSKGAQASATVFITVTKLPTNIEPRVEKTTPFAMELNVPINNVIRVGFSEQLSPIPADAITVSSIDEISGETTILNGTLSLENTTITFSPSLALMYETTYQVTVKTTIADLKGLTMTNDYVWQFTTTTPTLDKKPTATDDLFATLINEPIVIRHEILLSNDADPEGGTLQIDNIDFDSFNDGKITDNGDSTFTYTPKLDFDGKDSLNYRIRNQNNVRATGTIYITVSKPLDIDPPIVDKTQPTSNQTNVAIDSTIKIWFSESTLPVPSSAISVIADGREVEGNLALNEEILTFTPSVKLNYETTYKIRVNKEVMDIAGNNLKTRYEWKFSTIAEPGGKKNPIDLSNLLPLTDTMGGLRKKYYFISGLQAGKLYNTSITKLSKNANLVVFSNEYKSSLCGSSRKKTLDDACFAIADDTGLLYIRIDRDKDDKEVNFLLNMNPVEIVDIVENPSTQDPLDSVQGNAYRITNLSSENEYLIKLRELPAEADLKVFSDSFVGKNECASNQSGTKDENCLVTPNKRGELLIQVDGSSSASQELFELSVRKIEQLTKRDLPYESTLNDGAASFYKASGFKANTQYTLSLTEMDNNSDLHIYDNFTYDTRTCNSKRNDILDDVCLVRSDNNGSFYIKVINKGGPDIASFRLDINTISPLDITDQIQDHDYADPGNPVPSPSIESEIDSRFGNYYKISKLEKKQTYAISLSSTFENSELVIYENKLSGTLCKESSEKIGIVTCFAAPNSSRKIYISVQGPGNGDAKFALEFQKVSFFEASDENFLKVETSSNPGLRAIAGLKNNSLYVVRSIAEALETNESFIPFYQDLFFTRVGKTQFHPRSSSIQDQLAFTSAQGSLFFDAAYLSFGKIEILMTNEAIKTFSYSGTLDISSNEFNSRHIYKIVDLDPNTLFQFLVTTQGDGMEVFWDEFKTSKCVSKKTSFSTAPGEFCTTTSDKNGQAFLYLPDGLSAGDVLEILPISPTLITPNFDISASFNAPLASAYFQVVTSDNLLEISNLSFDARLSVYTDSLFSKVLCKRGPCNIDPLEVGKDIYIKLSPEYGEEVFYQNDIAEYSFSVIEPEKLF